MIYNIANHNWWKLMNIERSLYIASWCTFLRSFIIYEFIIMIMFCPIPWKYFHRNISVYPSHDKYLSLLESDECLILFSVIFTIVKFRMAIIFGNHVLVRMTIEVNALLVVLVRIPITGLLWPIYGVASVIR